MPRLTEEGKRERQERILAGARRCFARYGYEGATVARLEQATGLSRGAIFNWFPSKEALFLELASRDNTRLLELFVDEGLDPFLRALVEEDADWLAVYLEFGRRLRASEELRERWKRISPEEVQARTKQWIVEAQRTGQLRDDVEPEEIGRYLGVVFDGIVTQRALGFDAPARELVGKLLLEGLAGASTGRRRRPSARAASGSRPPSPGAGRGRARPA
ncbi:MAG TPA: TetR/AcrR family transcriptional regulator [Gaiellaceae bacterium]